MPPPGRIRSALPRLGTVVRNLIAGLCAAYVAQLVLHNWLDVPIVALLALSPGVFAPWQLVTYVLVDLSPPGWFLLGLLFLYWSLSRFESDFGPKRTLQLCAVSVLAASVPVWLLGFALPGSPLLAGSTPLWYGGMAATTWLYRDQPMSLFGAVTMTARNVLYLLLAISVLGFLFDRNHTQFVGTLGAMAGGIAFVRWLQRPPKRRKAPSKPPSRRPSGLRVIEGGQNGDERPKWLN
jgi:membrane associated rhomboid family serine protease